jgi:hypothetical protein
VKKFYKSDAEIMDSQFLSSNSSMDDINDIDEHSGLKKLEKHLGSYDDENHHPTVEDVTKDKIQLVTEISTYQDDEIVDNISNSIPITHTSIRSRMLGNYKSRTEDHENLSASQINDGVEYINGGKAILKRCEEEVLKSTELKLQQKSRNVSRQPQMLHHTRKYYNTQGHYMNKLEPQEVTKHNEVKVQEVNLFKDKNIKRSVARYNDLFRSYLCTEKGKNKSQNKHIPKHIEHKNLKQPLVSKNNLRSLPDQNSNAGSSNRLDFYQHAPGKTTHGSRYDYHQNI